MSSLSSECKRLGFAPMSAKNAWKLFFQRSQTLMPRPPYLWYFELRGFKHRDRIDSHATYSRLFSPLAVCP